MMRCPSRDLPAPVGPSQVKHKSVRLTQFLISPWSLVRIQSSPLLFGVQNGYLRRFG